ncbi:MAG: helix-turn-helix domain containing protein [Deltaproteobacteria bacterium]|nr:helix-turn-helix domain containing protein [Deltaproteobacteria bacterium]
MARTKRSDPKLEALRRQGTLHPHPERVADPLFAGADFFDPRDLVQVKYEMVRRVRSEGLGVSHSARSFGLSRPCFYQAQAALEQGGLAALLPKKRGPRRAHKLGTEVVDYLRQELQTEPTLSSAELQRRVHDRFGLEVHPRSIERALARREKKRP